MSDQKPQSQSRGFPAQVVQTLGYSDDKVVINRGAADGVNMGSRFLVYAVSEEELLDPETNNSLGHLEIVRGRGVVTHVQEQMATLEPEMVKRPARIIRRKNLIGIFGDDVIEEPESVRGRFEGVQRGDKVKPI